MNSQLVEAAADLEAKGWSVNWEEGEPFFKAINRSLTNGEIVVSVVNGKVVAEAMWKLSSESWSKPLVFLFNN